MGGSSSLSYTNLAKKRTSFSIYQQPRSLNSKKASYTDLLKWKLKKDSSSKQGLNRSSGQNYKSVSNYLSQQGYYNKDFK